MRRFTVRELALAAVTAAVYVSLTLLLPAYGPVQVRLAEALTVLPYLFPAATPGLVAGCFLANLFSPYPLDILCGTTATLLACLITERVPRRWMAPIPPVLCNALIVGAEISWYETGLGPGFPAAFLLNAATVGLGELLSCCIFGGVLLSVLPRIPALRGFLAPRHLQASS